MASFPRKNLIFGDRLCGNCAGKFNSAGRNPSTAGNAFAERCAAPHGALLLQSFSSRKLIWIVSGAIADIAEDCTGLIEKMIIKKLGLKPRP
ncbi:MAG: hypothetical protein JGK28_23655 [Microcoleus sp. PH2017_07_MST_O_A]|nr:hypothetical protein [Microcoleus sp. PH2017_07_MST_O_A]TAE62186.1 MAG: hypothetical protein EAZ86_31730 [Oscillatoriales cyanobacterium]